MHLAGRCRDASWSATAQLWAASQPAPVARALASRIAPRPAAR
ncbi:hypothetical protein BH11MYX4_BH11MYX4_36290 [soil metagenome]